MENYLVNPMNPLELLRHKAFSQKVFRIGKTGRFRKLKNPRIATRKRVPRFGSLVRVEPKENTMNPLMLLNRKRAHHRRRSRKAPVRITTFARETGRKTTRRIRRAVISVNPRRHVSRFRRFRHNPMLKGQLKGTMNMVLTGATIVAGATLGVLAIGKLSARFPIMTKPAVKIGSYIALGTIAYLLLKRVKAIPANTAMMAAVGMMVPAMSDVRDIIMAKMGQPAPAPVSYGAYVPQAVSAYVPQTQGMGYGSTY